MKTWSWQSNSVTRQVNFNKTNISRKCQNDNWNWDILSGQKFIKNAKNGQFLAIFWNPEVCGYIVLPDRSIGQKLGGKHQNWKKIENATFWAIFKHCALGTFRICRCQYIKSENFSMKLSFTNVGNLLWFDALKNLKDHWTFPVFQFPS